MRLKARLLDIKAGRGIVVLGDETASFLGLHSSDRLEIAFKKQRQIAIVNTAGDFPRDSIGLFTELSEKLGAKAGETVEVEPAETPEALSYVQAKIRGERLKTKELDEIVEDVVTGHLSDIELASFITSLYVYGLNIDETEALCKAMVRTGSTLKLDKRPVLDKHSIGGIPGDKTSLLIVPIVAAAGFTIPKTSSRAVTSPAGTADRVESLCPVNLTIQEIKDVVKKTNGCMVWGGALELAPADDIFIQVEYPLGIDPMLLPSIMSKKKAIGATHLVIDIPTGNGAKIKTVAEARNLADDFIDLGKRLGIKVQCAITFGEQPLGHAVGPALEAREALSTIMGSVSSDLADKATSIAGLLFEMMGLKKGKQHAERILKSGKAETKLRQIIEAQGGDPKIKPEDIQVGGHEADLTAEKGGRVLFINNLDIARIAREAGAPKEKGAGILLKAKIGEHVDRNGVLFKIFAERNPKLESALKLACKLQPVGLSGKPEDEMLIERIPRRAIPKKAFILER
jgi:AMP phosphorylase